MKSTDIASVAKPLGDASRLATRIGGKRLAVFLGYDGTLTPIVRGHRSAGAHRRACVPSALRKGIGMLVADPADPETAGGITAAKYAL